MRIKIDKEFTMDYQIERVKADAKAFKEMYTDGDLVNAVNKEFNLSIINPDIIKVEVEAFDSGNAYNEKTSFAVRMILDDWHDIYKIRFFCDLGLDIRKYTVYGDNMYQIRKFKEV